METLPLVTLAFISVLGMAVPGPDVVLAISNGSRYGIRRALFGVAGVVLSDIILICVVAFGFGVLLAASEFCLSAVRMVGAIYLFFIAVGALRTSTGLRHAIDRDFHEKVHSTKALMFRCFMVAVTNPGAWLFFPAVLPPFVDTSEPIAVQYAVLAVIIAVADVFVLMLYAMLGSRAAKLLAGPNAMWIDRLYGMALLGFSSVLLLQSLGHL